MEKSIIASSLIALMLSISGATGAVAKQMATVFHPETGHRKAIEVGNKNAFDGGYILEVARVTNNPSNDLGISVISNYSKSLSASINSTQSTLPVTSMTTKDGHTLNMGDFGSKVFLVLEPGKSKEEIVMCTGISGLNWTGCTRGLAFYGTSTASIVANRKTHQAGATVIISNVHYVIDNLSDIESNEIITGRKEYLLSPIVPTPSSSDLDSVASVEYVNNTAVSGAADMSETIKGLSEGATRNEMAAGTANGSTGAGLILQSKYATSTGGYATTSIPITGADGKLSEGFIPESVSFSGTTTFSGVVLGAGDYIFGNGSDGDATTSVNTSLTEDKHYTNLVVNSGVTLNTNGYRLFVSNLFINNGTTTANGTSGGNASVGTGGATGTAIVYGTIPGGTEGKAGAAGKSSAAPANSGLNGNNSSLAVKNTGSNGGGGGTADGCNVTVGGGAGTGGTATITKLKFNNIFDFSFIEYGTSYKYVDTTAGAGSGGAGGYDAPNSCSNGTGTGGGGGGSGGSGATMLIYARKIVNNGIISSNGGNGGNGGNAICSGGGNAGGGGGGAGGNGGFISLFYRELYGNTPTVNGGSAGTFGTYCTSGSGTAQNGSAGSAGSAGKISYFLIK